MVTTTDSAERKWNDGSGLNDGLLRLQSDQRLINRIMSLASGGSRVEASAPPPSLQSEIAGWNREQLLGLIEYSAALVMLSD
ncbi:MAG: hypothetical protein H6818_05770 [Phycisphaerales bacterium]|nr:hypothetical protein [Phycisphaerales bacterium]MCB9862770.1 hypothetical protein [Phycisphaerales bacterium]